MSIQERKHGGDMTTIFNYVKSCHETESLQLHLTGRRIWTQERTFFKKKQAI